MRQAIDVATKKTYREIIDGQQRLRAITEFVDNKFQFQNLTMKNLAECIIKI